MPLLQARQDEINVGEEMTGPLKREDIARILNRFYTNDTVKELAAENGLDSKYVIALHIPKEIFIINNKI